MTAPMGRLAEVCKTPEDLLVYVARVSNPANQENVSTGAKLLKYCITHKHWSIFETVNVTIEIETSRAIAAQILRHRSFVFQEFSQRYSVAVGGHEPIELRVKGGTNRQGSLEPADRLLQEAAESHMKSSERLYEALLDADVAPESARFVLPLATRTTLYMTGNIRSWIFYLEQRTSLHAQKEHRDLANLIQDQLSQHFPVLSEALGWEV